MAQCFSRAALAAGLGLGVLTGLARAQGVRVVPEPAPGSTVFAETMPMEGGMVESSPEGHDAEQGPPGHFARFRQHWMNKGVWCWTSHNSPGCGSLKADCTFIFGSCRQFFGEPCFGGPAPSPAEYYYRMQGHPGPYPSQAPPTNRCGCQ